MVTLVECTVIECTECLAPIGSLGSLYSPVLDFQVHQSPTSVADTNVVRALNHAKLSSKAAPRNVVAAGRSDCLQMTNDHSQQSSLFHFTETSLLSQLFENCFCF